MQALSNKLPPLDIKVSYNTHTTPVALYADMAASKFVFCPSGLGFDTYRLWETLLLGAIPVVESNAAGLDRTYGSLPVLVVRDFSDVTSDMLEKAYECFRRHAGWYKFAHLSLGYWVDAVRHIQRTGSSDVYNAAHPGVSSYYCQFICKQSSEQGGGLDEARMMMTA